MDRFFSKRAIWEKNVEYAERIVAVDIVAASPARGLQ